jgi:molecular chaperone GrpE
MPPESVNSDKNQIPEDRNEAPENETAEAAASSGNVEERETESEDLAVELAKAQVTIKEYWDQIVRLNAEIENNRKRAQKDIENAHKYAMKGFVESLLPVSDSMELGLNATSTETANLDSIREGMNMTLNMFAQMLEKNGIKQLDPVGDRFNPEHHQAMTMQEDADAEPNTVLAVMQKGYLLNDRLIRPAMVVVSKEKSS